MSLAERPNLEGLNGAGIGIQSAGSSSQQSQPRYFVALARLQLTNLPEAADLTPHRTYEFTVRLSRDRKITFCDHRVSNVFAPSTVTPEHIIGKPFTDLIVGVDGLTSFSTCFEKGRWSHGLCELLLSDTSVLSSNLSKRLTIGFPNWLGFMPPYGIGRVVSS